MVKNKRPSDVRLYAKGVWLIREGYLEQLEREAAAGRVLRESVKAIANDFDSPFWSYEVMWNELKRAAQHGADEYDKTVANER